MSAAGRGGGAAALAMLELDGALRVRARARLRRLLREHRGRVGPVAELLGVHPTTLRDFAAAVGLELPPGTPGKPPGTP